jgi:hypothetical protein
MCKQDGCRICLLTLYIEPYSGWTFLKETIFVVLVGGNDT